jgi:hypothetical protein
MCKVEYLIKIHQRLKERILPEGYTDLTSMKGFGGARKLRCVANTWKRPKQDRGFCRKPPRVQRTEIKGILLKFVFFSSTILYFLIGAAILLRKARKGYASYASV